ncbi:MAG: hypothetical protein RBT76_11380 [candidate division Zixibacteria bacterium]|nr:hypothetical protein [candidate division Zixibacteria bacterium]
MRLLELHIEVSDLERSLAFYRALLPHHQVTTWADGSAAAIVFEDGSALGLWKLGKRGLYDGRGAAHLHFAFKIEAGKYNVFRQRLVALGCEPIDHVWPNGERSIYSFDPDGHHVEFMTVDWIRGVRD